MEELINRLGSDFVSLKPVRFEGDKVTMWKAEVSFGQFSYTDITIVGALRKALDDRMAIKGR